jgi:hypothetical protein
VAECVPDAVVGGTRVVRGDRGDVGAGDSGRPSWGEYGGGESLPGDRKRYEEEEEVGLYLLDLWYGESGASFGYLRGVSPLPAGAVSPSSPGSKSSLPLRSLRLLGEAPGSSRGLR